MEYWHVPSLRPTRFHTLLVAHKTPNLEFFSSSRPYFCLKSQILGKFTFQSLKISKKISLWFGKISVLRASNWTKNKKTPNWAGVCSFEPPFRPQTRTKMESWLPWGVWTSNSSSPILEWTRTYVSKALRWANFMLCVRVKLLEHKIMCVSIKKCWTIKSY